MNDLYKYDDVGENKLSNRINDFFDVVDEGEDSSEEPYNRSAQLPSVESDEQLEQEAERSVVEIGREDEEAADEHGAGGATDAGRQVQGVDFHEAASSSKKKAA